MPEDVVYSSVGQIQCEQVSEFPLWVGQEEIRDIRSRQVQISSPPINFLQKVCIPSLRH